MWFDFCDETIGKTRLPKEYNDKYYPKRLLIGGSLKNSLVLCVSHQQHKQPCTFKIDIWVMKKLSDGTSWSCDLQSSVQLPLLHLYASPLANGYLNGEVLLFRYVRFNKIKWCFQLLVYDFNKFTIRNVRIQLLGDPNDDELLRIEELFI